MNNDLDKPKLRQHAPVQPALTCTEKTPAEKHEFFGNMGHELRNPLSNIIAQVETLLEGVYGPLETAQQAAVSAIQDSARQLLQLVADVVDLGRMEAGGATLAKAACDLSEQCAGSVATVAALAKSRSIQVVADVQPRNLGVLADARRLQQIITELLSAAILSMHTGSRLRLQVMHEGDTLHLQTLGSGGAAGASAQLIGQLGKVKPIGLALLQRLVHLHDGSFEIREAAGHDVSLLIRLPLEKVTTADAEQGPAAPEPEVMSEDAAPAASEQPTILIADDQPALLTVTRNYLESLGFNVITARDGSEAVQQACTLQPDLILMDVRMPVVDGLNAIRQIRASDDPKTREIAIVSLSGHVSAADKEKCMAAGATAYLNKPFGVRELDRIISDHIRKDRN